MVGCLGGDAFGYFFGCCVVAVCGTSYACFFGCGDEDGVVDVVDESAFDE